MGLFKSKRDETLKQDLSKRDNSTGAVFIIRLLMDRPCEMPSQKTMSEAMTRHLGMTDCVSYDKEIAGFSPKRFKLHLEKENKDIPPLLSVMKCSSIKTPLMDNIARTQLWDCKNADAILSSCKYEVVATDMLAACLDYRDRADMLVGFIEALVEMFPSCKAVLFENSKKMLTREKVLNCKLPKESRFIYYAVNVRFFNIKGGNDMLVDTLGMSTLFMPDLQYHFHGLEPNSVVNHAYNVLSYMFENANPVKSGDYIDGIKNGKISEAVQWKVQYENSLIQPVRQVIDVNMGQFASGKR